MANDSKLDVEQILQQLNQAADKRKEAEAVVKMRLQDLKQEFGIDTVEDAENVLEQMEQQHAKLEKEYQEKYDGLAKLYLD